MLYFNIKKEFFVPRSGKSFFFLQKCPNIKIYMLFRTCISFGHFYWPNRQITSIHFWGTYFLKILKLWKYSTKLARNIHSEVFGVADHYSGVGISIYSLFLPGIIHPAGSKLQFSVDMRQNRSNKFIRIHLINFKWIVRTILELWRKFENIQFWEIYI